MKPGRINSLRSLDCASRIRAQFFRRQQLNVLYRVGIHVQSLLLQTKCLSECKLPTDNCAGQQQAELAFITV